MKGADFNYLLFHTYHLYKELFLKKSIYSWILASYIVEFTCD